MSSGRIESLARSVGWIVDGRPRIEIQDWRMTDLSALQHVRLIGWSAYLELLIKRLPDADDLAQWQIDLYTLSCYSLCRPTVDQPAPLSPGDDNDLPSQGILRNLVSGPQKLIRPFGVEFVIRLVARVTIFRRGEVGMSIRIRSSCNLVLFLDVFETITSISWLRGQVSPCVALIPPVQLERERK